MADDHAVVREGLKRIVASANDMEVVGEAVDGVEVMRRVRESDFDVLVLDLAMPLRSGMKLINRLHGEKPNLRILVLGMHQELQHAVRAIMAGANGYLTMDCAPAQLIQALRRVAARGVFISAEVAEQLALGAMQGGAALPHEALSNREFEVFRLLADGVCGTDIAARLKLSVKTVSTHKANLMQKMGLQNHSELIRYAIKHGVSEPL